MLVRAVTLVNYTWLRGRRVALLRGAGVAEGSRPCSLIQMNEPAMKKLRGRLSGRQRRAKVNTGNWRERKKKKMQRALSSRQRSRKTIWNLK